MTNRTIVARACQSLFLQSPSHDVMRSPVSVGTNRDYLVAAMAEKILLGAEPASDLEKRVEFGDLLNGCTLEEVIHAAIVLSSEYTYIETPSSLMDLHRRELHDDTTLREAWDVLRKVSGVSA